MILITDDIFIDIYNVKFADSIFFANLLLIKYNQKDMIMSKSEKEKMISGEMYNPNDEHVLAPYNSTTHN